MRLLALAALLTAGATPVLAAEPLNILGTWVPVSHAAARIGTTPSGAYDTYTKPRGATDGDPHPSGDSYPSGDPYPSGDAKANSYS